MCPEDRSFDAGSVDNPNATLEEASASIVDAATSRLAAPQSGRSACRRSAALLAALAESRQPMLKQCGVLKVRKVEMTLGVSSNLRPRHLRLVLKLRNRVFDVGWTEVASDGKYTWTTTRGSTSTTRCASESLVPSFDVSQELEPPLLECSFDGEPAAVEGLMLAYTFRCVTSLFAETALKQLSEGDLSTPEVFGVFEIPLVLSPNSGEEFDLVGARFLSFCTSCDTFPSSHHLLPKERTLVSTGCQVLGVGYGVMLRSAWILRTAFLDRVASLSAKTLELCAELNPLNLEPSSNVTDGGLFLVVLPEMTTSAKKESTLRYTATDQGDQVPARPEVVLRSGGLLEHTLSGSGPGEVGLSNSASFHRCASIGSARKGLGQVGSRLGDVHVRRSASIASTLRFASPTTCERVRFGSRPPVPHRGRPQAAASALAKTLGQVGCVQSAGGSKIPEKGHIVKGHAEGPDDEDMLLMLRSAFSSPLAAFRFFDSNGDGLINEFEFQEGLARLCDSNNGNACCAALIGSSERLFERADVDRMRALSMSRLGDFLGLF